MHLALVGEAAFLHLEDLKRRAHAPPAVAVEIAELAAGAERDTGSTPKRFT
jgi:hypothetical protein